tara:strand:- start:6687 stop:7346 length:660 start_codon:yes stop_codon:yes gene_type:complete
MASEIIGSRWTLVLLRELVVGSTRFNQLRRGVPRMSPALMSKRLKDLEAAGIITRDRVSEHPEVFEYNLTPAGRDLRPIIEGIGAWGQRWVETNASLENLDVGLLMWDIRRNIDTDPMPKQRSTIQVIFSDQPKATKNWWLIVDPDTEIDLCSVDPGFDVDLFLVTDLRKMTEIWMGYTPIKKAVADGSLQLSGKPDLREHVGSWLSLSPFARIEKKVA